MAMSKTRSSVLGQQRYSTLAAVPGTVADATVHAVAMKIPTLMSLIP